MMDTLTALFIVTFLLIVLNVVHQYKMAQLKKRIDNSMLTIDELQDMYYRTKKAVKMMYAYLDTIDRESDNEAERDNWEQVAVYCSDLKKHFEFLQDELAKRTRL